ncbi:ATP-binding cassette domain-containing protein [Desulfocurvus sp. DL9XJH121]
MISLHNVGRVLGGVEVVGSATLRVAPGRALCILGPSGCGKTTLLETAAGLARPDSGTVALGTRRVACAFQDDVLVPWLSALDNVALVLPGGAADRRRKAGFWLDRLDLPHSVLPPAMSGGMRRRLNLARALAAEPEALFLDEPFAFLDEAWQLEIARILGDVLHRGGAALLTSHQTGPLDRLPCDMVHAESLPLNLDLPA